MKKTFKLLISAAITLSLTACTVGNIDRSKVISAQEITNLLFFILEIQNGQAAKQNTGIGYSRFVNNL